MIRLRLCHSLVLNNNIELINLKTVFMQTKHTPGPWKIGLIKMETDTYLSVWPEHTAESQTGTAVCLISAHGKINEQDEANARLIETAPELLQSVNNLPDLLRKAAEVLEIYANRNGGTNALNPKLNWYADKIEAAIKKATYENPIQKSKL